MAGTSKNNWTVTNTTHGARGGIPSQVKPNCSVVGALRLSRLTLTINTAGDMFPDTGSGHVVQPECSVCLEQPHQHLLCYLPCLFTLQWHDANHLINSTGAFELKFCTVHAAVQWLKNSIQRRAYRIHVDSTVLNRSHTTLSSIQSQMGLNSNTFNSAQRLTKQH